MTVEPTSSIRNISFVVAPQLLRGISSSFRGWLTLKHRVRRNYDNPITPFALSRAPYAEGFGSVQLGEPEGWSSRAKI